MINPQELLTTHLVAKITSLSTNDRENVALLIAYMEDRKKKKKSGSITYNTNRDGITETGKHRIELTA